MYFDLAPKAKKEDFFNYDYQYSELKKAIAGKNPIIAVLGARRVGKTSLMNIIFNETTGPKLWLDGRALPDPKKELISVIYDAAKTGKSKIFGKVESLGVSALGLGVEIKMGAATRGEMERKIAATRRVVVFIDEAQRADRKEMGDILSYFYDRLPNVIFVLSGSEIGLVEEVLGEKDPKHALYGRLVVRIKMERFDKSRAMEFLKAGFLQAGYSISASDIDEAISELDGLAGWLTMYGHRRGLLKKENALEETVEIASRIAASEIASFMGNRKEKKAYESILRRANGISWSELKLRVEEDMKSRLSSARFTYLLDELMRYSFIEKGDEKYSVSDPLLRKATFL